MGRARVKETREQNHGADFIVGFAVLMCLTVILYTCLYFTWRLICEF